MVSWAADGLGRTRLRSSRKRTWVSAWKKPASVSRRGADRLDIVRKAFPSLGPRGWDQPHLEQRRIGRQSVVADRNDGTPVSDQAGVPARHPRELKRA